MSDFRADGQASMLDAVDPDQLTDDERRLLDHPEPASALRRAFDFPPFTVLDTRSGDWTKRKKQWLALGIQSELGRGAAGPTGAFRTDNPERASSSYTGGRGAATVDVQAAMAKPSTERTEAEKEALRKVVPGKKSWPGSNLHSEAWDAKFGKPKGLLFDSLSGQVPDYYAQKRRAEAALGRELTNEEFERDHLVISENSGLSGSGTSVFDPVLCELTYRWFCPPGGTVLDPFAGGSVRGVVAACLGLRYTGIELQGAQVMANQNQWVEIAERLSPAEREGAHPPVWFAKDSREYLPTKAPPVDLVFTCPPYYDLEVYSDDPRDLSALPSYGAFVEAYSDIINRALQMLADHRFAVFVVGDIRDKRGLYRGLVKDTVDALEAAGAAYYNHAVLVNSVGSLPVRVPRQFRVGRKLGKTHQDVVVGYKGDPAEIRNAFPEDVMGGSS